MGRLIRFAPLVLLLLLVGFAAWRIAHPADPTVRSRLAGQPVPTFDLPPATASHPGLASRDLTQGRPRLVNIFASWCVPCIAEAPLLARLHEAGIPIDGIAVRDRPEDVASFLDRTGAPFERIGSDQDSRVQLSLGSSGVPETFLVDGRGIIRYQHVGPIEEADVQTILAEWGKWK